MSELVAKLFGLGVPEVWGDMGTVIGAAASSVAACIALVAAGYAKRQIEEGRKIQSEILARQTYSSYLLKALEHPDFASGRAITRDFEKYEWFVSYMLNACEGIILHLPKDKYWESCVKSQLENHRDYLKNNRWFCENYKGQYSPAFVRLIDTVRTAK